MHLWIAFQASHAWDGLAMPGGRIHDRAQYDVPHLLGPDGPGRLPHPRTRRDGAPEMPGITPRRQSVAWRHLPGTVPGLRPSVRERVERPADVQGVSVEEWDLRRGEDASAFPVHPPPSPRCPSARLRLPRWGEDDFMAGPDRAHPQERVVKHATFPASPAGRRELRFHG
jgi:hypothetical protein